jgi:hypothetical protein
MKNALFALLFVGTLAAGCAGGPGLAPRGSVIVSGDSVKAFATGPAVVHAFSQDRGGDIFTATATTGTDADCLLARAGNRVQAKELRVDQRNVVEVQAGQVACVATESSRRLELLWHAEKDVMPTNHLLVAQVRR